MTHLAPRQQDLLAAAYHRRLVRAGFHPTTPAPPVHSQPITGPEKRIQ